jgi:hypothetical protein
MQIMLRSESSLKGRGLVLTTVSPNSDVTMVTDPDVVICKYPGDDFQRAATNLSLAPLLAARTLHLLRWPDGDSAQLPPDTSVLLPATLADIHLPSFGRVLIIQTGKCTTRQETQPSLVPVPQRGRSAAYTEWSRLLWILQSFPYVSFHNGGTDE